MADNTVNNGNPETTPQQEAGKLFTQDEVNRIVQERLAKEKAKYEGTIRDLEVTIRTTRANQMITDAHLYSPQGANIVDLLDLSSDEALEASFNKISKFMPKQKGGSGFSGLEPPDIYNDPIRKGMGLHHEKEV